MPSKEADYQREYYRDHPEYRERSLFRKRKQQFRFGVWMHDYLAEHPCIDCGETDPITLEFDHLKYDPTNRDVACMGGSSYKVRMEEVAKCEVVCANCHTKRTAKRANSTRWRVSQGFRDESQVT